MKWRALTAAAVAVLMTSALAACGSDSGSDDKTSAGATGSMTGGDTPTIGLVMKSLGNSYFQDMQKGAQKYADEHDTFTLKSVGTQSETDINGQVEAVNNLVAQGVDAIVIAPADSIALVAPLTEAVKAGIKVVNIDVKLDDDAIAAAGIEAPFVGPDNVEGARQVGETLAKELGTGGKVVILEGIKGAANAQQRKAGFDKAIADGGLNLLASTSANWETDQANTVFTSMLSAHPDIQGVMCANDSMALGVLAALEAAGKAGDIKVVAFDNIPEIKPYLDNKELLATLDQFGSQQAAYGIEAALDLIQGNSVDTWKKTPIELIKAD